MLLVCNIGAGFFEKELHTDKITDEQKKALDDSLTNYLSTQEIPLSPQQIYLLTLATVCLSIVEDKTDDTPALEKAQEKRGRGRPPGAKNKKPKNADTTPAKPTKTGNPKG